MWTALLPTFSVSCIGQKTCKENSDSCDKFFVRAHLVSACVPSPALSHCPLCFPQQQWPTGKHSKLSSVPGPLYRLFPSAQESLPFLPPFL